MTATGRDDERDQAYRRLSLWHETVPGSLAPRPPLRGDVDVDVAIVGAGFTGLWSAYYLVRAEPTLRVAVLERDVAGFGASGRNGGWCSALFPVPPGSVARVASPAGARALQRALQATVDEVGRVAAAEGIDCHWAKGGTVVLARSHAQLARARHEVDVARTWGAGEQDVRLLDQREAYGRLAATEVLGGTYTPHCAAVHPARLVRGLATVVEGRGVRIYEGTPVTGLRAGAVDTAYGRVTATFVLRATEGYTAGLRGHRRAIAPVYSLVLATEPLRDAAWDRIGLRERETFSDHRHLIVYGQRTADGRMVFGGRGAPYHFGSGVRPAFDREPGVFADLHRSLVEFFPVLADAAITHAWGGPLGIPRDWFPSVGLDRRSGLGWAGGYVGDGVGSSNLAGRTFADLVLDRDTDLVRLPWVGHRSPRWEPEPLRWAGLNAGLRIMAGADRTEERTGRSARRAAWFRGYLGE